MNNDKVDLSDCVQRATVYDPKRMDTTGVSYEQLKLKYIDLTKKLEQVEQEKNKEIDKLWNETIIPLQNQVKDKNIQLDTAYNIDRSNKERIKDLEKVIDNLNMTIQFAAGYISSTPQFSNQHPMNVLYWLRGIRINND